MRHGIQKQIAIKVGVTAPHLNAILSGKGRPGRKTMMLLEAETGIPKEMWAFATGDELRAAMTEKYPKKK